MEKWTIDYLVNVNPEKKVKVHKSDTPQLNFREKNFSYETVSFSDLIKSCTSSEVSENSNCNPESGEEKKDSSKIVANNFWYLRSLGEDPR